MEQCESFLLKTDRLPVNSTVDELGAANMRAIVCETPDDNMDHVRMKTIRQPRLCQVRVDRRAARS
jgi:hypothetical protein